MTCYVYGNQGQRQTDYKRSVYVSEQGLYGLGSRIIPRSRVHYSQV